jgi:hypothetical protein
VVSTEHPHQQLHSELLSLFARHDPVGLVKIGAPDDEYSPEVERILARMGEAHSVEDLGRIIHEVFISMFDERLARSPEHYRDIALEAWDIATRLSGA